MTEVDQKGERPEAGGENRRSVRPGPLAGALLSAGFALVEILGEMPNALREARYNFFKSLLDAYRDGGELVDEVDPDVVENIGCVRSLLSEVMGHLVCGLSDQQIHGDLQAEYMKIKGSKPDQALNLLIHALLSGDAARQGRACRIVAQHGVLQGASPQTVSRLEGILQERNVEAIKLTTVERKAE